LPEGEGVRVSLKKEAAGKPYADFEVTSLKMVSEKCE
jgi:hypothetical protein